MLESAGHSVDDAMHNDGPVHGPDSVTRPRIRQPLNQRALCQGGQNTKICARHRFGGFSGETADENRQRAQHRPLPCAQPVPGTLQDHVKAAMTLLDGRPVRGEASIGLPEMIKQVARRQNGDPACRQLDAERQAMGVDDLAQSFRCVQSAHSRRRPRLHGRRRGRLHHPRTDPTRTLHHPSAGRRRLPRPIVQEEFCWSRGQ